MKNLHPFRCSRLSIILFMIAALCVFKPSAARGQSSGPNIDVCDYDNTTSDSYGDQVEYSDCLTGDSYSIDAWVEVSVSQGEWSADNINLYAAALAARVKLYDNGTLVADSGEPLYDEEYGTWADTGVAPTNVGHVYSMYAYVNYCYDSTGNQNYYNCGWSGDSYLDYEDGTVTNAQVSGYINPKYIVLGVTYAPPGPASSVTYTDSTTLATTNSLINSRSSGTTYSVSLSNSIGIGGWKVGTSVGYTNAATQTTKDTQTTTLNWATTNAYKTNGTPTAIVGGAYTSPVDHDYDTIYVWLNPVEVLTLSPGSIVWNGYGYDADDQNGMDIVPIALGYLNGDFGPMPSNVQFSLNRGWAAGQMYAPGDSAALNSNDLAAIAQSDPFSSSSYGPNEVGYIPPTPTTPDNRFTISTCNSSNSVFFGQADPSQPPDSYTCTLSYSNMTSNAQAYTTSSTSTYSLDRSYSGSIFSNDLTVDFKVTNTTNTSTEVDSSISNTAATGATFTVVYLPCNNAQPYVGPCVPVYLGPPLFPTEFMIYQDDQFGTFMFAPLYYY